MITVKVIYEYLQQFAPLELQMSFDNSGFQTGRLDASVTRAILSLDVTPEVIDEAAAVGAQLIITHHPLIFTPLRAVADEKLLKLAENRISVISMHTNLDIADCGVNDVLISLLGAAPHGCFETDGCGRFGELPQEMDFADFLMLCKSRLHTNGLRYYSAGRGVKRLAVLGGAGGDCVGAAADAGCDTFVTADIKYHQFLEAKERGMNLIDGDHFCTENPVMYMLRDKLTQQFSDVRFEISSVHRQVVSFI